MNRILFSVAAVALFAVPAFAADLPARAPIYTKVPPPPVYSWNGCNLNAGVGYGLWKQDHFGETFPGLVATTATSTAGGRGWLGRVGGGCDYQIDSRWVIGAFADYDFMNLRGTFNESFFGDLGNEKETGAWSVGGRIGYLVTPSLLTYFDGGYTQARFSQINLFTAAGAPLLTPLDIASHTYNGWFIGGGAEYNLGWLPGLFWRNEIRYASYQAADLPVVFTATGVPTIGADHVKKYVQTYTSSLVWRFNWWGGPSY